MLCTNIQLVSSQCWSVTHFHSTASTLPACQFFSPPSMSVQTTKAAAHRSVKQHDGCRSRRQLLLCGCRPQPLVAPNQTKECLAFPATACVEAKKTEERREGSCSKERSNAKKKKNKLKMDGHEAWYGSIVSTEDHKRPAWWLRATEGAELKN